MPLFSCHASSNSCLYRDKLCIIAGASQGLGEALALELASLGAHLTLIARNSFKLDTLVSRLNASYPNQSFMALPCDLSGPFDKILDCLDQSDKFHNHHSIYMVFCCVGGAKPELFMNQSIEDFEESYKLNYKSAVQITKAALGFMIKDSILGSFDIINNKNSDNDEDGKKNKNKDSRNNSRKEGNDNKIQGHLVFISSMVGLFGMIGYSQYSPMKFAIRGLAECLRQELLFHNIQVHTYFVGTINSPGLAIENQTKPEILKLLEEGEDPGSQSSGHSKFHPRERAKVLLKGIEKGQFAISSDWQSDLFRAGSLGCMPRNNIIMDMFLSVISWFIVPIWRWYADRTILTFYQKKYKKNEK